MVYSEIQRSNNRNEPLCYQEINTTVSLNSAGSHYQKRKRKKNKSNVFLYQWELLFHISSLPNEGLLEVKKGHNTK